VKTYRFEAEAAVGFDVEGAFEWYETEEPGLGLEFLQRCALPICEFRIIHSDIKNFVSAFGAPSLDNSLTRFTFQWKATPSSSLPFFIPPAIRLNSNAGSKFSFVVLTMSGTARHIARGPLPPYPFPLSLPTACCFLSPVFLSFFVIEFSRSAASTRARNAQTPAAHPD
jgi:hypothetical protein